jgi:DNA-binding transcriptional ArsR family regulator
METRRDVFQAIAEPTRREIIGLLADRPLHLNAIAENFNVSRPAISQHIKILEECGLIIIRQQGRERYCEAQLEKLTEVVDWVEQSRKVWMGRFRKMDQVLRARTSPEKRSTRKKSKSK